MNSKDSNSANIIWSIFIFLLLMGTIVPAWQKYYNEGNLFGMLLSVFIGVMLLIVFVIEFIIKKFMKKK